MAIDLDLDYPSLHSAMTEELKRQMLAAAEPVIQDAMKEIERGMRERVAAWAMGVIDKNYDMWRNQNELMIRVNLGGK